MTALRRSSVKTECRICLPRKEGGNLTRVGAFYNASHSLFRSRVEQFLGFLWHFALIRNVWTGQAEDGVDKLFKRVKVLLNFANLYPGRRTGPPYYDMLSEYVGCCRQARTTPTADLCLLQVPTRSHGGGPWSARR